jgi:hypothetical protein
MKHTATILLAIISLLISPVSANTLNEQEIRYLLFMTEEEKLAHDVCLVFQRKYRDRIFPNLRRSERLHMDTMAGLLDRYGLENPTKSAVGEFDDQRLQGFYDRVFDRGMKNRVEAIMVAALVVEKDVIEIAKAMNNTDEPAIMRVYAKHLSGSERHLKAIVYRLDALGVTYEPVFLSLERYQTILES